MKPFHGRDNLLAEDHPLAMHRQASKMQRPHSPSVAGVEGVIGFWRCEKPTVRPRTRLQVHEATLRSCL